MTDSKVATTPPRLSPSTSNSSMSDEDDDSNDELKGGSPLKKQAKCHRILIVEDFDLTSKFLSNTLKYCRSALCTCATSGEDALNIIRTEGTLDVVLTDVMMKGIGGIEFIKQVREHEETHGLQPQIILAMSADESNSEASLKAGSSLFIFKYNDPMHRIFEILDTIQ